jgi:hypothetical protein
MSIVLGATVPINPTPHRPLPRSLKGSSWGDPRLRWVADQTRVRAAKSRRRYHAATVVRTRAVAHHATACAIPSEQTRWTRAALRRRSRSARREACPQAAILRLSISAHSLARAMYLDRCRRARSCSDNLFLRMMSLAVDERLPSKAGETAVAAAAAPSASAVPVSTMRREMLAIIAAVVHDRLPIGLDAVCCSHRFTGDRIR